MTAKEVKRLEYVGHMPYLKKRFGAILRKLKTTNKSALSDGKAIGGKGRLTDKMINKLQNYFGIAIRQLKGKTVYELKKAIDAVSFHCSEASNLDTRHQICPRSSESWCKFQADKINNTSLHKNKPGLPSVIRDAIKPIFMDLSDDNLLKKCLQGQTQNNNESLNGVIWKRSPKYVFVGRSTLEMGVTSAVINFNDGRSGILKVMENLSMNLGENCIRYCNEKGNTGIKKMEKKSTPEVRHRRKQLRAERKGFADVAEQNEGVVYGAGLF